MKRSLVAVLGIALAISAVSLCALAGPVPGQVDFGKFASLAKGGQFVEIQLNSNLIAIAAQIMDRQQPEAASLLRNVQLIHVNVFNSLAKDSGDDVQKLIEDLRADLESHGWDRNVSLRAKDGQDVTAYTKAGEAGSIAGLVVLVVDSKNLVLVNIMGNVKLEQIGALGDSLDIKPLKDIREALKRKQ